MKKTIILSALMAAFAISANAQFKVSSSGTASVGPTTPISSVLFRVCDYDGPYKQYGILTTMKGVDNNKNVGVRGIVNSSSTYTTESNFGVLGTTIVNSNHGRNFGVAGMLTHTNNYYGGAGVYATDNTSYFSSPDNIQGLYAAYFRGSTNLQGRTMAQEIYTPADNRLSVDAKAVATRGDDGTPMLSNLLRMNVREFTLKNIQPVTEPVDTCEVTEEDRQAFEFEKKKQEEVYSRRHFGLSAQELQEIYPNLVLEAQDGYLYVNYTELVPVLIRAIQELKEELDNVKGGNESNSRKAPADKTSDALSIAGGNVLYQNTPNPFKEQTTIRFSLADDARDASVCIFDMMGKMLKKLPVSSGETSVSVGGWELGEGMFLYTLIVNGKEIDTKRMIITK